MLPQNIKPPTRNEVTAELCRRSLYFFVKEFWDGIISDPFEDNWHIEYLCDEVQLVIDKYVLFRPIHIPKNKWYDGITENIQRNLIGCVPPGTSKSTILSRMTSAWLWCIDDTKTIISNTISDSNATGFAKDTKDIIKSEKFQMLFPKVKIRHDVSATKFYESINGGTRYSYTTKSKSKTGKHAHLLTDDDAMDYSTAQSPAESKECIEGFKALRTRMKDKRITPYILFMQRLSSRDTVAHALKALKGNVRYICLPAENIYKNVEPTELTKFYKDDLLDPIRLSRKVLFEQKMGLNDESKPISDIAYNIQFNQANETSEGLLYPNINLVDSLPENRQDIFRYSFTDVADTGSDNFSTWFVEVNRGKIYIYDGIYTQEPSGVTSKKIQTKINMHYSMLNMMETNNQGSVFITLMQQMGCNVKGYYSSGNKEHRISAWAQLIQFIYFVRPGSMPYHSNEYAQAVKHVQSYPKTGKHEDGKDDAEDSLTEVIRYLYTNARQLFNLNP